MNYVRRLWLNDETSPSTGSVCAYNGQAYWTKDECKTSFLEVADCHYKVRLHKTETDTDQQFIDKLIKLRNFIDDFIGHLQNK